MRTAAPSAKGTAASISQIGEDHPTADPGESKPLPLIIDGGEVRRATAAEVAAILRRVAQRLAMPGCRA